MSTKKTVSKPVSAKKTSIKKKVVEKKVAAKKAPEKKSPEKKTAEKKAAPVKKAVKPAPAEKTGVAAKPKSVTAVAASAKPVKKNASKKTSRVSRDVSVDENAHQDFAFSFAEEMKRAQRAETEARGTQDAEIKLSRRPDTRVKGMNTQKFPDDILDQFKKSLLQLRQAAIGQSVSLRNVALEQVDERGGEDEDGSDAFLRLQNLSHVDSQNRIVQKIDEALARIEDGTYGVCENCGQLIRKARLQNLPFVHTCMECQTLLEQR